MPTITVRTVDLETTGFPPEADIVEAGFVDILFTRVKEADPWAVLDRDARNEQRFFKPDREICLEARATHHITDNELEGAEHHSEALNFILDGNVDVMCAHNAAFEMQFIPFEYWIDTYKVALRLYPDSDKHNNQYLRYMLGLDLDPKLCMPPHRANPDAYTTSRILLRMLQEPDASINKFISWSKKPIYLTKIGFGKHAGQKFVDLPKDYLNWIIRQNDMDEAVIAAARRVLYGEGE